MAGRTKYAIAALMIFTCVVSAKERLTIYTAASTTNVIQALIKQYTDKNEVTITPVFASSSSLARQIEQGAPADLFISANRKWMDYLVDGGIVDAQQVNPIAYNDLVLIAPASAKARRFHLDSPTDWRRILQGERLAIGQPESVPAGIYAKQALRSLGVWSTVKSKLAPAKSVRTALAMVERGEAALGIVYATDEAVSDGVTLVGTFPASSHKTITYPMATLKNDTATRAFARFIRSQRGKQIFRQYGFNVLKQGADTADDKEI